jgi:hypothetical protein
MHSTNNRKSNDFKALMLCGLPQAIARAQNALWNGRFWGAIDNVFSVSLQCDF